PTSTNSSALSSERRTRHSGPSRRDLGADSCAGRATFPNDPPAPGRARRPDRLGASRRGPTRPMTKRALIAATAGSATFAGAGLLASTSPLTLVRIAVLGGALA